MMSMRTPRWSMARFPLQTVLTAGLSKHCTRRVADEKLSSDLWGGALTRSAAERIGRHGVLGVHSLQPTDLSTRF